MSPAVRGWNMTRCLLTSTAFVGAALLMTLGLTASAAADVRVFVTSSASGHGLDLLGPRGDGTGTDPEYEDWPIDPFRPTYSTVDVNGNSYYGYDYYYGYYRVAAFPPIDAPSGTIDDPILIDAAAGEWAYIWFQFRGEPKGVNIRGTFVVTEAGGQAPPPLALTFTYYLQNDLYNPDSPKGPRWVGMPTPPEYPEWRDNPQMLLMFGGGGCGLPNAYDDPQNMFDNQAIDGANRTGVGLIGAITAEPSDTVYEYSLGDFDYFPRGGPDGIEHTFFKFVPEPGAGVVTTVTAALLCRPRRSNRGR